MGIANKESIICGWKFIKKSLKKNNTNFVPLDSEHFSIWSLIKSDEKKIIMFPAGLNHVVYPFYTSDDYRITISGNVHGK